MAFRFVQWFSAFFDGFPISSTAVRFLINPGKSIYGGKYTKDCYLSFVFPAQNRDIPG
jgi:hypothetical protein